MVQVVSLKREGFLLPMIAPCLELWGKKGDRGSFGAELSLS
jgi:hypothetical protein